MAVYTDVSFDELERFLKNYRLGPITSFKGIAEGVENTNFHIQTAEGAFILTLYEKRVREADLPFFLGLMEHLASKGVPCPLPVRTLKGLQWTTLNGKPAALLSFLKGVSLRRPDVEHCAAAGKVLAALHAASADFKRRRINALGASSWSELTRKILDRADMIQVGLRRLIEQSLDQLESHWPRGLPEGVIHADLFPDNVLFLERRISGLIDFYFACNDALAYDIAVMLNAWCFESDGFNVTKSRALVSAYVRQRPLSADEIEALPRLAAGAALRFLLTRLYDLINHNPMALVRPKDPREFARRLRFHLKVKSASEYGL